MHRFALLVGLGTVIVIGCSATVGDPPSTVSHPAPTQKQAPAPAVAQAAPQLELQAPMPQHAPGHFGGFIAEFGGDPDNHYHAEAVFEKGGIVKLYTLGKDETRILEVELQTLEAHARAVDDMESSPLEFTPMLQEGDRRGMTALFQAQLPEHLRGKHVILTIPLTIEGERFRFRIASTTESNPGQAAMPAGVSADKEQNLFLKPGGKYTQADIDANGRTTPAVKFKGMKAAHDMRPKTGDRLCPITMTKANPAFTWIIDGQSYQFCCPPCIDELVLQAKEQPAALKPANSFIKK